jgi:hypothetical protein
MLLKTCSTSLSSVSVAKQGAKLSIKERTAEMATLTSKKLKQTLKQQGKECFKSERTYDST